MEGTHPDSDPDPDPNPDPGPDPNPNPNPNQVWEIPKHIQPVKEWDADMTYFSPSEVHA